MPLNKDEILALANRRETRTVTVDGYGDFILKEMSGTDRNAFEASMMRIQGDQVIPNMANAHAKLVSACLVDESGERMFTSLEDVGALGALPAKVLARLFDEASELNGLSEADVEELAGNSDAAESGASTSPSPATSSAAQ